MRLIRSTVMLRASVACLIAAALVACTDFSTTPASLGRVTVAVTDDSNQPVPNTIVDLLLLDRTGWRSLRTAADGTGEFGKSDGGVISQMYIVRITPDVGYTLADDDTNDKPVTVVIGQTHHVTFKLVKRVVSPPGT